MKSQGNTSDMMAKVRIGERKALINSNFFEGVALGGLSERIFTSNIATMATLPTA